MHILVVEDEASIRDYLKKNLEKECYVVDTAEDGATGSFKARTNNYDLMILDNIMPKKCGIEVCQEIRNEGKTIPILILSVKSETTTKVDLLNAGADDYLTKPFSFDELIARMRALMRRPSNIEADVLRVGDLVLDMKKHKVTRDGELIQLTRKEFALLQYLMKNKGIVLSRGMLLEHVWDMSVDPFSNTIESHILSLRKKIDIPQKPKLIYTISGFGYKIDDQK